MKRIERAIEKLNAQIKIEYQKIFVNEKYSKKKFLELHSQQCYCIYLIPYLKDSIVSKAEKKYLISFVWIHPSKETSKLFL